MVAPTEQRIIAQYQFYLVFQKYSKKYYMIDSTSTFLLFLFQAI